MVLQALNHPRVKEEAEGKDMSQGQVINAVLWETRFQFLLVGCLVDLGLYCGCRVVKEADL